MERARCFFISLPGDSFLMPGVSFEQKFGRLGMGVEPEDFFPFRVEKKLDCLSQILQTIISGRALAIGPRHFQTRRPKTPFVWFTLVNDRRELFHAVASHLSPAFSSSLKIGMRGKIEVN